MTYSDNDRVAAVDLGSNALRFMAAQRVARDEFTVLANVRAPVRLGTDAFANGRLRPTVIRAATAALTGFRKQMDALGVSAYRAVATSAVRDCENRTALLDTIRQTAAIVIEVIDAAEEMRLVARAVRARVELGNATWLLVDVGGGSAQFASLTARDVRWTTSCLLGAVRLLQAAKEAKNPPARWRAIIARHLAPLQHYLATHRVRVRGLIAVGGGIDALAQLAGMPPDSARTFMLPVSRMDALLSQLAVLSPAAMTAQYGVPPDRADLMVPAAMTYLAIARTAGVSTVIVPRVSVREGIILDLLQAPDTSATDNTIMNAAICLGRAHAFEEGHAQRVATLALQLFDQLHTVHRLDSRVRRLLMAAALLHDIGICQGYAKHHKQSLTLISQATLPGLTSDEMAVVANTARYHRRKLPQPRHTAFAALSPQKQDIVCKLAAILRIADALDRRHCDAVRAVHVAVTSTAVIVHADAVDTLEMEQAALLKKADLFERIFDLRVQLSVRPYSIAPSQEVS